ncbi:hypothetical protein Egran_05509, partial [Elaphomyces granulatus]
EPAEFLGLEIERDRPNRYIRVYQTKYTTKILDRFANGITKSAPTPWPRKVEIPSTWKDEAPIMTTENWLQRTGSLNYLSMGTRPDITYTTNKLSEANANPTSTHAIVLERLWRYLRGTATVGIILGGKFDPYDVSLRVYADASFADDLATRASTAGHVVFIGDGPIFWKSKRQTIVTTSTTEAEFINLTPAGLSALWVANLLSEAGHPQKPPVILFTDSQNARLAVLNRNNAARTRHIDIRYKWIIYRVEKGQIHIEQIGTDQMIADGFTKPLERLKHRAFVLQLRMA